MAEHDPSRLVKRTLPPYFGGRATLKEEALAGDDRMVKRARDGLLSHSRMSAGQAAKGVSLIFEFFVRIARE
jgi:hypothetical protein